MRHGYGSMVIVSLDEAGSNHAYAMMRKQAINEADKAEEIKLKNPKVAAL